MVLLCVNMKNAFFTVGPSQLFPGLKEEMVRAIDKDITSISHRGQQFMTIVADTTDKLRKIFEIPSDYRIYLQSSATEAMERIIENTVENSSSHFVNGSFSEKFFNISKMLGRHPKKNEVSRGTGFRLREYDEDNEAEVIALTHNETSTGVMLPVSDIYYVKKKNPKALLALDIVSSAPYKELDFSMLDAVFFSVQKGFGLPAGLGILIVSPAAFDKSMKLLSKGVSIGSYHSFEMMEEYMEKNQTFETPNVFYTYLLGWVCDRMLDIGVNKIREVNEAKAKYLYEFFDNNSRFKPFVKDRSSRSRTILTLETGKDTKVVMEHLKARGLIVSGGLGQEKGKIIRIANFYSHTNEDVERLISAFKEI